MIHIAYILLAVLIGRTCYVFGEIDMADRLDPEFQMRMRMWREGRHFAVDEYHGET